MPDGRGIRGILKRERPVVARWTEVKEAMARDILLSGWNPRRGAFTQSYGSNLLDANLLLLVTSSFLPPEDDRVHSTAELLRKELAVNGLVYRYRSTDATSDEGAFVPCSFWLVNALAALGKTKEATELFEALLSQANHVGLYAEEIDPLTGEFLGNFPQAFSHLALIESALALDEKRSG